MCLVKPCACGSSFEPTLSYILRERVVYLTTRMAVCACGWSQRPRALERALLGRHPRGPRLRRSVAGNRKREKGREEKKAAGARMLFHRCSLSSTGYNRFVVSCGLISPKQGVFWQNAPKWKSISEGPSLWIFNRQLSLI